MCMDICMPSCAPSQVAVGFARDMSDGWMDRRTDQQTDGRTERHNARHACCARARSQHVRHGMHSIRITAWDERTHAWHAHMRDRVRSTEPRSLFAIIVVLGLQVRVLLALGAHVVGTAFQRSFLISKKRSRAYLMAVHGVFCGTPISVCDLEPTSRPVAVNTFHLRCRTPWMLEGGHS